MTPEEALQNAELWANRSAEADTNEYGLSCAALSQAYAQIALARIVEAGA